MKKALYIALVFLVTGSANAQEDKLALVDMHQFYGRKIPAALLKTVSVNYDNTTLENALTDLGGQSGILLNYNRDVLPLNKTVTLRMDNVYVLEAMLSILKTTGTSLYITDEGQLVVGVGGAGGSSNAAKETGRASIKGVVRDNSTGEPLPGANVIIKGTSLGAATNIEGQFTIPSIPPGNYILTFTFIGFQTLEKPVSIMPGKTVHMNAEMDWVAITSQDIVITAQAEGQLEAINQQLRSKSISSIVAGDRIQEVPDANAAESVGRLPGVSIKRSSGEGDQVVIRGLQPRLNLITVNNIRMPSTNESNSAVGLAGISQYMLDGIEVRKSLNASDDADVVGGIVDLKLATAPEGFHWSAIIDGTYNGLTDSYGNYRGTIQGSSRFFNNSLGVIGQVNIERADRTRERYSSSFSKDERDSINEGIYLQGGGFQMHDIQRDRFSISILADYKLPDGKIQFNSIYNKFDEDSYHRDFSFSSGLGKPSISKSNSTHVTNNYSSIYGMTMETGVLGLAVFDISASMTSGKRDGRTNNIGLKYDTAAGSPIDPVFGQNPYGKIAYDVIPYFQDIRDNYLISQVTVQKVNFDENESALQSNLKIPFALSKQISGSVKMGGKIRSKERNYDFNPSGGGTLGTGDPLRTAILRQNPDIDWPLDWETRDVGTEIPAYPLYDNWSKKVLEDRVLMYDFCDPDLVDQVVSQLEAANWEDISLFNRANAADIQNDYKGDEKLYAGYFMIDIDWSKWISLNAGLRYEHEETNYKGYGVIDIASYNDILDTLDMVKRTNFYLLPSTHLRFNYTSWGDIRLAYSKSLARPEYYAFIPHYYANLRYSLSSPAGNPALKPALSNNYDIIFSFYTNHIGLFTVGGFYKKIDDFFYNRSFRVIEEAIDNAVHSYNVRVPQGEYINVWFNNTEASSVKGLELDWQTSFWYLPRPLNGLVLSANYTRLSSKSYYYVSDIVKEYYGDKPWEFKDVRVDSFLTRRLLDQPDNVFNVSLGYDYKAFSLRVAYYFLGNTLASKGDKEENDTFTQDYQRLDLSIRQRLPIHGLSMQFLWSNITAEPDEQYRWLNSYNTFEEYYGSTASLGIRYEF